LKLPNVVLDLPGIFIDVLDLRVNNGMQVQH